MNKVILIGNLGADPELRYTQGGKAVCSARIATNTFWTAKDGTKQKRTEWHRITVWGNDGVNLAKYMHKGGKISVEGRLQTREWTHNDGSKRYTTEVVADTGCVEYLSKDDKAGRGPESDGVPEGMDEADFSDLDNDIPV